MAEMHVAAELDSTAPEIPRELSRLLLQSHRPAEAVEPARRATTLAPSDPESQWLLGESLLEQSKFDEAIVSLRHALELDRTKRNYTISLVMALDLSGRPDQALQLLRPELGGLEPDTPYLYFRRGELEERLGRPGDALADYLSTIRLAPGYPDATARLLAVCNRLGASDSTAAACSSVLQIDPRNAGVRRMLAQILVNLGRDQDALPHLEALYQGDSLDARVIMQLGVIEYGQGRPQEAIQLIRKARKIDPTIPDVDGWLWRSLDRADSLEEALHVADQAVAVSPLERRGHWFRAVSLSRLKRYADARSELEAVERISPGDRDAALLYALILTEQGDLDGARSRLAEVLKASPEDHEALFRLAQVEQRAGKPEVALALLRRLIESDPTDASALNEAGYQCADMGVHLGDALEWTRRAVALEGNNPAFRDSYGWALFRLGRYLEAITQLQEAAKGSSEPEIRIHLAQALWAAGRREEGAQILRQIVGQEPGESRARQLLLEWGDSKPDSGNPR